MCSLVLVRSKTTSLLWPCWWCVRSLSREDRLRDYVAVIDFEVLQFFLYLTDGFPAMPCFHVLGLLRGCWWFMPVPGGGFIIKVVHWSTDVVIVYHLPPLAALCEILSEGEGTVMSSGQHVPCTWQSPDRCGLEVFLAHSVEETSSGLFTHSPQSPGNFKCIVHLPACGYIESWSVLCGLPRSLSLCALDIRAWSSFACGRP